MRTIMKLRGNQIGFFTMILGIIIFMTGCETLGLKKSEGEAMKKSEQTRTTMEAMEDDIKQAIAQVDATGSSLDLIKPGHPDLKEAFKKYSDNVDKTEQLQKRLFEHADKMSVEGNDYFEEWRKQGDKFTNPRIQALSEQRRAELSATFAKIREASLGMKGPFRAYMSDIKEIRTYLSNDLTPKGIEAIAPIAQKAIKDGDDLKNAVNPVLSAINNARAEMTESGTK